MSYIIQSIVHCRLSKQGGRKYLAGVMLALMMMIRATEFHTVAGQSATPPSTAPASKPSAPPANPSANPPKKASAPTAPVGPLQPAPSNAQKTAELRSLIETEQKQLEQLKQDLANNANPDDNFTKTETNFKKLDNLWKEAKKKLADLKSEDQVDIELVAEAQGQVEEIEPKRKEALSAYELEIEENKTLQEKILTIQKKVNADILALERLTKPAEPTKAAKAAEKAANPGTSVAKTATAPAEKPHEKSVVSSATEKPKEAAKQEPEKPQNSLVSAAMASSPMGIIANASANQAPKSAEEPEAKKAPKNSVIASRVRLEIKLHEEEILDLEEQLQTAKLDEAMAAEQVSNLDQQVKLEEKLRDNARKKADLANEILSKAQEDFRVKSISDAPQELLKQLAEKLLDLDKEFQTARNESRLHSNRLADIQTERSKQQDILRDAHDKTYLVQKQIDETQAKIAKLQDPTSLLNILDWLATRGVRIFIVLILMIVSRALLRSLGSRAIRIMVQSQENISLEERTDRAETLVSVYSNAVSVGVIGGGFLLMAQEAGVPIGPLLGGAAIFGLAIAFGAQSLIKDYFYGFVILLENQFSVNDVIQVGVITGVVERITLRMTVLRDVAGTVHFVPNGSMTTVSNFSYDWSRAVFEIPVSYKAQVDDVIQEIHAEGKKFRLDKEFGPLCLDDLIMLGVDQLAENFVMIKFYIKTKPLKQWPVKRELLRRLKNRFDLKGIDLQTSTKSVPSMIRADSPVSAATNSPNLSRANRDALTEIENLS
jgi:small conductance mechanosensitive channel